MDKFLFHITNDDVPIIREENIVFTHNTKTKLYIGSSQEGLVISPTELFMGVFNVQIGTHRVDSIELTRCMLENNRHTIHLTFMNYPTYLDVIIDFTYRKSSRMVFTRIKRALSIHRCF